MKQMLLIADERPLVERLGAEFFRQAPECPGVYLMRDARETVLYVGKAKNLRKRLGSYRVANPDRMGRRHLRLLRSVARIELIECGSESSALAKEDALLRNLRPQFNRAGTWPGAPRFLSWQLTENGLALAVMSVTETGWNSSRSLGAGVVALRSALVRLLWCAIHPERGLGGMPAGWFRGRFGQVVVIPYGDGGPGPLKELPTCLQDLCDGGEKLMRWFEISLPKEGNPFEVAVRNADLEFVKEAMPKPNQGTS